MMTITHQLSLIKDTDFTEAEVREFIETYGGERFETILNFYNNFKYMIQTLYQQNQIIIFHDRAKLTGVCGWFYATQEESQRINKIRWELPKHSGQGDVIYIAFCVMTHECQMTPFNIKSFLKPIALRNNAKEVLWFTKKWVRIGLIK